MSDWWEPLLPVLTVYEQERTEQPVVYDHTGQALCRPRPPMGFIDPNNMPRASTTKRRRNRE